MSNRNLALSGWSGAGLSSTTLILAILLSRKYYPVTEIFRTVVRQLKEVTKEKSVDSLLANMEKYFQPFLGKTVDQYVDHLLIHAPGIILENDISAFRLGKRSEYYSIFIKTDYDVRAQRFNSDDRTGDQHTLRNRDLAHKQEYKKLWNIDFFDLNLIKEKFNFILDNSQLTLDQTVNEILNQLKTVPEFKEKTDKIQPRDISELTKTGAKAKDQLRQKLQDHNLLISPQQMITEINQKFPEQIQTWPEDLKNVFNKANEQ